METTIWYIGFFLGEWKEHGNYYVVYRVFFIGVMEKNMETAIDLAECYSCIIQVPLTK